MEYNNSYYNNSILGGWLSFMMFRSCFDKQLIFLSHLQICNILLLQEMLTYQHKFAKHYADGLDGCGLELESRVRKAFYTLVTRLVKAVRSSSRHQMSRWADINQAINQSILFRRNTYMFTAKIYTINT